MSQEAKPRTKRTRSTTINKEHFTLKDGIKPKTEAQRQMIEGYVQGQNIVAYGSAGSGKSYVACYLGLKDLFEKEKNKIIIVRSAVPTRDMGFLPGNLDEKAEVYSIPYKAIVNDLCQNGTAWEILSKKGLIQFITTSYIRGITLDNCVIIFDEFQNCDAAELESVLTRLGENSQIIICGDTRQSDLKRRKQSSGFDWLMLVAKNMPDWFDAVHFRREDIVRSEFVKELIGVIEDLE